jgi:hypothetical protein
VECRRRRNTTQQESRTQETGEWKLRNEKRKTTQPRFNDTTDNFREAPGGRKKTLTQGHSVFNCIGMSCCRGLFRMVLLSQFALESVLARTGTIEFPHDKAVFLNEIKDSLISVRNPKEPFMLVNVALDNVYLSIQDIMKMFAFVEHGETVSVFAKSIAFLDSYGNR